MVVAFGQLRTSVSRNKIELISNNEAKRETRGLNRTKANINQNLSEKKLNFKAEIDIRGQRAEEAIANIQAFVDDAVMLDLNGFVSETNATNIFLVKRGKLLTPHADSCLPGITRGFVLQIAQANAIPTLERNITIAELYSADELFTTGTMGELTPVLWLDGRTISDGVAGPLTRRLQQLYAEHTAEEGEPLPF